MHRSQAIALTVSVLVTCSAAASADDAAPTAAAAPAPQAAATEKNAIELSTLWYLSYLSGTRLGESFNRFHVGRGYLTAKVHANDWLGGRLTVDTHQMDEGPAEGDWSVRLKYLYALAKIGDLGEVITGTNVEFGLAHTPWIDFEEQINAYRMQGSMFLDRGGIIPSADLGITLGGLLGPKLDDEYQKEVSKAYPGTFGSFAVGVYNGGGYDAVENNESKTIEGRLSVRPLGPLLPNLQLSYLGIFGKGNTEAAPDWRAHAGMLSFQHQYFAATAQAALGTGNKGGSRVTANAATGAEEAVDFRGYSGFLEVKLPWINSSLIGRYDAIDWNPDGDPKVTRRAIAGAAYHIHKRNTLLVDWEVQDDQGDDTMDQQVVKATLRLEIP